MANYRRFVTYFYDYSSGNKGGICGFGKIEYSMRSRVHITMQGNRTIREECVVYGMSGNEEPNQTLGRFQLNYGKGSFLWEWNGKEKSADLFVRNMVGIVLFINDTIWAATRWDGIEFDFSNFLNQNKYQQEEIEEKEEKEEIEEIEEIEDQSNSFHTSMYDNDIIWNQLCNKYAKFMPFPQSSHMQCLKIHLGDLRRFSGENRKLANNNFLLRGYYRCHYIVLSRWDMEDDAKYYIGIPGIYQEREAKLASHFGFCVFAPFKGGDATNGKGGLWMTPLHLLEEKA